MERLSKKEKGFVKDFMKSDNACQSVMKNYNVKKRDTASVMAYEILQKPKIIAKIQSIAEQIPDSLLVEKHLELLNAEKIVKIFNKGEFQEQEESIDNQSISKGLDMAYKLKGSYAPDKNINININQEQTPEQIAKGKLFDEWLKKQQT